MPETNNVINASTFFKELQSHYNKQELDKLGKFFRDNDGQTKALGVRFGEVFKLAKQYTRMSVKEIEKLLDSKYYEVRMGAVSIMDYKVQQKGITKDERKQLFDLYLNRHDRINNWDLVDRAAKRVIGGYLYDFGKDRKILYELAKSENVWKRRTAIVSTSYFISKDDLNDTFSIAQLLLADTHDLIQKAVGGWMREAGKKNEQRLLTFLDKYASQMPAITLRYTLEKLDAEHKKRYRK